MAKLIVGYALIGLLTFGHSASSTSACTPRIWDRPLQTSECRFMLGMSSAVAWPLYWSWAAFDAGRALTEGEQK